MTHLSPPPQDRRAPLLFSDWGALALLALVAALLYGHTLHAPWYFDDHTAILDNPAVHELGRALAGLWQPRGIATLSFALNYRLFGSEVLSYHLGNIALHLACAGLVYRLLGRIFTTDRLWPLFGALLFLAHPVQTQAVTYIVQRMTLLAAVFSLLSLELFLRFRETTVAGRLSAARWFYAGALLAGGLAVGAKENAAILPLALLLFVRSFANDDQPWRPLLLSIAPFFIAPLVLATLRLLPLLSGNTDLGTLTGVGSSAASPLRYLVTEWSVLWIYLRLFVLPYGQTLDYGYPLVSRLLSGANLAALLGLLALGGSAWRLRQRLPTFAFGIGWFFLTLAVESSIIPLDPLFEHRLYLPLFGLIVALLGLVQRLPQRRLAVAGLLLVLITGAVLTWQRNTLWNDQLAFSADNVRKAPQSDRALFNLAARTINRGQVAEGLALLRRSIERFPQSYRAYAELADYYRRHSQLDQALAVLQQAVAQVPDKARIYNNLGFLQMLNQDEAGALASLHQAERVDPHFADTYFNTARIHAAAGRSTQAEAYYCRGFQESRTNPSAYVGYGLLLEQLGRRQEAQDAFRSALRLDPESAEARERLDLQP